MQDRERAQDPECSDGSRRPPGPERPANLQGEGAAPDHPTEILLRQIRAGDRKALDDLFRRYLPVVRQIAALRLGRRLREMVEVDDIVGEVLLGALKKIERFEHRGEGSFRNWLARQVENAIATSGRRLRAQKRGGGRVRRFGDWDTGVLSSSIFVSREPSPSEVVRGRDLEERLERALLELPERDRETIILRKLCDMSYEEMAEATGAGDPQNSRRAFSRALEKLAGILGES